VSCRRIPCVAPLARGYRELRTLQWIPLFTLFFVATHGLRGVSLQLSFRLAELKLDEFGSRLSGGG
jgi:hypothetical protein